MYVFGEWREGVLDEAGVEALLDSAEARRDVLATVPVREVVRLLAAVAARFADPADPRRRRMLAEGPAEVGFSRAMVEQELAGFTMALSAEYALEKLARELGDVDALDAWPQDPGPLVRAYPRGVVLHVASGNVATAGVLSLVEGLLTRNVNVLKVASRAPLFARLFAEVVAELDPGGPIAASFAVVSWPGAGSRLHEAFQRRCDAIVVWGGEEAVRQYRDGASVGCHVVAYGPKVSFAAIAREHLADGASRVAQAVALARDVALWDQQACSSPQAAYLEAEDPAGPEVAAFLEALAHELQALDSELPPGPLGVPEKSEVTKEREVAKVAALRGEGDLRLSRGPDGRPSSAWTLVREADPALRLSPLARTLLVKVVPDLAEVGRHVAPYRSYLQTAGLAAPAQRVPALADAWARLGLQRIVPVGEMQGGYPGEPHDGGSGLGQLVRWVPTAFAGQGERFCGRDWSPAVDAWPRVRTLVELARARSPFYRERLAQVPSPVTREAWERIPPTTREDVAAHTPPQGQGLLTRDPAGAHYLRSGGSSGVPKLSIVAYDEYEADMRRAARGAAAAGLRAGDRVANLFKAGDLYGSFLSSNRMLELLDCGSFPIGADVPADEAARLISQFRLDAVMGLPTWILQVFDAAEALGLPLAVRKVLYAGEHLHAPQRRRLERAGVEVVASVTYGSNDAGILGYQCSEMRGGLHHVHDDHQLMEVVHPDTFGPLAAGEVGEILVTPLARTLMPLLRYRIGDLGRWVAGPCPCGRTAARFELLGRSDDRITVGSLLLTYEAFRTPLEAFPELLPQPQLVLEAEEGGDTVVVLVEREAGAAEPAAPDLAARVRAALLAAQPDLVEALARGTVRSLAVEVRGPGGLARGARAGKVRHVLDHRGGVRA